MQKVQGTKLDRPNLDPNTRFALTGGDFRFTTLAELSADDMVYAEVAPGQEGVYVNVAKWNDDAKQWQHLAYKKFMEGDQPVPNEWRHAELYANAINGSKFFPGFVWSMPKYSETIAKTPTDQVASGV